MRRRRSSGRHIIRRRGDYLIVLIQRLQRQFYVVAARPIRDMPNAPNPERLVPKRILEPRPVRYPNHVVYVKDCAAPSGQQQPHSAYGISRAAALAHAAILFKPARRPRSYVIAVHRQFPREYRRLRPVHRYGRLIPQRNVFPVRRCEYRKPNVVYRNALIDARVVPECQPQVMRMLVNARRKRPCRVMPPFHRRIPRVNEVPVVNEQRRQPQRPLAAGGYVRAHGQRVLPKRALVGCVALGAKGVRRTCDDVHHGFGCVRIPPFPNITGRDNVLPARGYRAVALFGVEHDLP